MYRSELGDTLPAGLPPEAVAAARDTLGGALAAARDLSDSLGTELIDAARKAFVLSLQTISGITAALSIGLAVLVVVVLGRHRPDAGSQPASESGIV